MTLCVAWNSGFELHLASDSRASLSHGVEFDHCVKVVAVPTNIYGVGSAEVSADRPLHAGKIGLCFAGNFLSAYTTKETVTYFLSSLQAVPGYTEVSLERIADIVRSYLQEITSFLAVTQCRQSFAEILICGYCPKKTYNRAFRLVPEANSGVEVKMEEILTRNGDILFIGTGADAAERYRTSNPPWGPLEILRAVVRDDTVITVGGSLQYGHTNRSGFEVFGVEDYLVNEEDKSISLYCSYNGFDLAHQLSSPAKGGFHMSTTFVRPFAGQLDRLLELGYHL